MKTNIIKNNKIIEVDICNDCQNEKEGFYIGESDNHIFLCKDCQNARINDVMNYMKDN